MQQFWKLTSSIFIYSFLTEITQYIHHYPLTLLNILSDYQYCVSQCINNYYFCLQYSKANINAILQKLVSAVGSNQDEIRSFFMKNDPNGLGCLGYDQLVSLLRQVDPNISDQEIMTVARHYSQRTQEDAIDSQKLVAIVQEQLRKRNYEGFGKLLEDCMQNDKDK